jgi:hypothetical protein
MLLSFRTANHRSLRTEQQLLLTPAYADDVPTGSTREAVPVAGIFGANASGKSNVLDALAYMANMTFRSFRESEPDAGVIRHPFALDPAMSEQPSVFVVDLLLAEIRYTYGFAVDDSRVVEEWLYSYPRKRQRVVYHRTGDDYSYGEHSPESLKRAAELTEPNVLFMSVAARSNQESLWPVYFWLRELRALMRIGLYPVGRLRPLPAEGRDRLTSLLHAADTGIVGTELVEETEEEVLARIGLPGAELSARLLHEQRRKDVVFKHRGAHGSVMLSADDQSRGTRALYYLGSWAFQALDGGLPLVVDELDASLHPFLTAQLIRLFRDPETNPRGAQLIFTSHDASLLGRIQGEEILHRDHVWFTEKDEDGATELFPLSDFKPRREHNLERRYLAGRYGAVPIVHDEFFAAALAARGDGKDVPSDS